MKYIDADKLKAEIERLEVLYDEALKNPSFASYESSLIAKGKHRQREDLLSFIDSLQQEQPDKETILQICKLHKAWSIMAPWANVEDFVTTNWNNENGIYECTGFCEKEQEQPKVDLEEEYKTWWNSISGKINVEHIMEWYMHETVCHFYELGLKVRKEE